METPAVPIETRFTTTRTSLIRTWIAWAVLAALIAIAIYGFRDAKLWHEDVWTPAGLRRFQVFAAGYWLCFAVFFVWKPELFAPAVLSASLVYTLIATGPLAVLSMLLVLLSSVVLGQAILGRQGAEAEPSAASAILAMLLGLSLYMFLLSITALGPVNYPVVYLALVAAPLVWQWRSSAQWLARIPALWRPLRLGRSEHVALAFLIFVLTLHWLVALYPEIGPDGLSMHLVVPTILSVTHRWDFDVSKQLWAVMPKGANWLFGLCYLLGGEASARLFNLGLLLSIAGLVAAVIRRWLSLGAALLLTALFAATPMVQLVTGSLFVENTWALLSFGALIALDAYTAGQGPRFLYLAAVLLGAAIATKAIALAFVPPFTLIFAWALWKHRPSMQQAARQAGFTALWLLVFALPPYWIALAKTGNPVFPYFPRAFPSKFQQLAEAFGGPPPGGPNGIAAPFYLTFHTGLYREVQDGAMGFQYFLLLPLGLVLLRRKSPGMAFFSVLAVVLFAIASLRSDPGARYLYAALPVAAVFFGAAFASARETSLSLYRTLLVIAAAALCLDIYFIPSSNWMFKDFVKNPASRQDRLAFVTEHAPQRNLIEYLNRAHAGAPVGFFESDAIAGLRAPALTTTWHTVDFYNRMLGASSPAECLRIAQDNDIRFVIAPLPGSGIPITTTPQENFLKQCTAPESTSGSYFAGRVKATCLDTTGASTAPLVAGEYDDWDDRLVFTGQWNRGRFPQAAHGTITSSRSAGAEMAVRFTGSDVIYVYTKAFNRGIAEVLLDGASAGTVDLYSPNIEWQTATPFRAGGSGPHTLRIRVSGRKNPAATDVFVDVDGVAVR